MDVEVWRWMGPVTCLSGTPGSGAATSFGTTKGGFSVENYLGFEPRTQLPSVNFPTATDTGSIDTADGVKLVERRRITTAPTRRNRPAHDPNVPENAAARAYGGYKLGARDELPRAKTAGARYGGFCLP